MSNRALLVVAHNLGDAVITSSFLHSLVAATPGLRWTVWCRPETAFLFEAAPGVEQVFVNRFPIGTNKQFGWRAAGALLKTIRQLRRMRFAYSVDFIGDFRDVALAHLAGSQHHHSPRWPASHSFRAIIRPAPSAWIHRPMLIPDGCGSVYEAIDAMVYQLADAHGGVTASERSAKNARVSTAGGKTIGVHPFASQACKLWPAQHWRTLVSGLLDLGLDVRAFAAPNERDQLQALFAGLLPESCLVTRSLREFCAEVPQLALMIGLDSFSVHVAHAAGIPSIMLNGANDPRLWIPPSGIGLQERAACGHQPCLNRPRCIGRSYEYSCMKAISASAVQHAVLNGQSVK